MRLVSLFILVACSSSSPKRVVGSAPPIASAAHSCADAALGLEAATKGVRSPDRSVFEALRSRCANDSWPANAVDCFAVMNEGELDHCARSMPDAMREDLFAVLAGGRSKHAGIVVARARLDQLEVGIPECDQFITTVATVLSCDRMPIDARVQLGNETADFWSLPTSRLGAEDRLRMSTVCGESRNALQQEAQGVGCMP